MEFNTMNLDELLNASSNNGNTMSGNLFVDADVEVNITKEVPIEEAKEETQVLANDSTTDGEKTDDKEVKTTDDERELNRAKAMNKLAEYEAYQNKLSKLDGEMSLLNQELDSLISKIKLENKELIDKINSKADEIKVAQEEQEKIKADLLPLQRAAFNYDNNDKTFNYNKIQSTYVEPSEKNKFDLKKFREEQKDFWNNNLDILKPYSEITAVSDYIKITVSKK